MKWLKKFFNFIFMKIFRAFNSREVSVTASTPLQARSYYRYEQIGPRGMALNTENFLRSNLLRNNLEKAPSEILKSIGIFHKVSGDSVYLLIAADVCRYFAENMSKKENIQYHLGALYNSYLASLEKRGKRHDTDELGEDSLILQELQIYNEAVAGIFCYLKNRSLLDEDTFSLRDVYGNEFVFEKPDFNLGIPRSAVKNFSLCSSFSVKALRLINRHSGVGVPLVASVATTPLCNSLRTPSGLTIPVTLYFRIRMSSSEKIFVKPYYQNTLICESVISVAAAPDGSHGIHWSLARDYTTPLACFMNKLTQRNLLTGMLNPLKYDDQSGLFMVEPYCPDKIPVIFVHGLMSSPETWGQMINSLKFDPMIRKKYQFWFYSYSTGVPIVYSTRKLRQNLLAVQQEYCTTPEATANFNKMVLVGHSMGGLLARLLMLQDWCKVLEDCARKPWAEIQKLIQPDDLQTLLNFWPQDPLPFVKRVVFMAVPHRGSAVAQRQIAELGIRLIQLPKTFMDYKEVFVRIAKACFPNEKLPFRENSFITGIDNLNPQSMFVKWSGNAELKQGIPYHSIIGNRKEASCPGGSDGIVSYASSHLNGVVSECIVKSDHSVHRNPEAIRELLRILLLHLQENQ